jgi:hypothetical protein
VHRNLAGDGIGGFVTQSLIKDIRTHSYILTLSRKRVNFANSPQNEGLSSSGIALSFDGFGSISLQPAWFLFDGSLSFHNFFFRISNFLDLSITEET